jgi:biopolymer transport protein ExbD
VKPLSPRARVKIAGAVFVLATFAAIVMVLTGGGGKSRHARRYYDDDEPTHDDDISLLAKRDITAAQDEPPPPPAPIYVDSADEPHIVHIELTSLELTVHATGYPSFVQPLTYDRTATSDDDILAQLAPRLSILAAEPDAQVVIAADTSIQHGTVVKVMDALKQAGFVKMALETH